MSNYNEINEKIQNLFNKNVKVDENGIKYLTKEQVKRRFKMNKTNEEIQKIFNENPNNALQMKNYYNSMNKYIDNKNNKITYNLFKDIFKYSIEKFPKFNNENNN